MRYEEFLKFCETRISNRQFSKEKVPEDIIRKIFRIGQLAPSSCNQQAYKFLVINKEEDLKELSKICTGKLSRSPQAMFCFTDMSITRGNFDNIQSTAASVMSMLYATHSLGLGGYWVAGFDFNKKTRKFFMKKYKMPKKYVLQALLLFGYKDSEANEYPEKCRIPLEQNFLINSPFNDEGFDDEIYLDKIMPVYFDRYNRPYEMRLNDMIRGSIRKNTKSLYINGFYGTYLNTDIRRNLTVTNSNEFANGFLKNKYPNLRYIKAEPEKLRLKKKFDQVFLIETLNHFDLDQTLGSARKALKDDGEVIIVIKNLISARSLIYHVYKFLKRPHYNQPLEYVRNPARFFLKREICGPIRKHFGKEGKDFEMEFKKVKSNKPVIAAKLENVFPSYSFIKIKLLPKK